MIYLWKLVISIARPRDAVPPRARKMTHPYWLFIGENTGIIRNQPNLADLVLIKDVTCNPLYVFPRDGLTASNLSRCQGMPIWLGLEGRQALGRFQLILPLYLPPARRPHPKSTTKLAYYYMRMMRMRISHLISIPPVENQLSQQTLSTYRLSLPSL